MLKLTPYKVRNNPKFINRERELETLRKVHALKEASIVVVSGRRRVGKTELIEQFFKDEALLKFEGIQPDVSKKRTFQEELDFQISQCCKRLAKYTNQPAFAKLSLNSWSDFFEILLPYTEKRSIILYFEEIQWLSNYSDRFTSEIKPFWDDHFRHNPKLRIIFSGSAPSFITKQFLRDSALYNRSTTHIKLEEFSLFNTHKYLSSLSEKEALTAQLLIGGIPEYLKMLKSSSSILQGLMDHSFRADGNFFTEHDKIFVSSMSDNKHYKKIIGLLASEPYLSREDILNKLEVKSNGSISAVLKDLEECGFISSYTPLGDIKATKLTRYCLKDPYLIFYYRFIYPHRSQILNADSNRKSTSWVSRENLQQTLGYAFERWCRLNPYLIAKCMKFDQIGFKSGAYFSRKLSTKGIQIDLLFQRDDYRLVVCEVKYTTPTSANSVFQKLQESATILKELHKKEFNKYSIEYALITGDEILDKAKYNNYFDHVVDLSMLMEGR